MDNDVTEIIRIAKAENGWIVHTRNSIRGCIGKTYVATSTLDLAKIVQELADTLLTKE